MNKLFVSSLAVAASAASAFAQTPLTPANFPGVISAEDRNSDSISEYYIQSDLSLAGNGAEYVIENLTFVENGAKLTIGAGAILRGQPASSASDVPGALIVTTNGTIDAVGSAGNPIIYTTAAVDDGAGNVDRTGTAAPYAKRWVSGDAFLDADPANTPLAITLPNGDDAYQLWGGVIILGEAPTNSNAGGEEGIGFIEGVPGELPGEYGGFNPNDDSGNFAYASIRHSGFGLAPASEIQGLTLGGVGYGTSIHHIDIYGSSDDGIEIFGGTVNLKYICITFADDDGFDIDLGYTGLVQFMFVLGASVEGYDSLGEWDGDDGASGTTATRLPLQYTVIRNATFIGQNGARGINMKENYGGDLLDSIIVNVPANGIILSTGNLAAISPAQRYIDGTNVINGVLFDNVSGFSPASIETDGLNQSAVGISGILPVNDTAANGVNPVPLQNGGNGFALSTTALGTVGTTANFFDVVNYRGAFAPDGTELLWTTGWTALNKLGILVDRGNDR